MTDTDSTTSSPASAPTPAPAPVPTPAPAPAPAPETETAATETKTETDLETVEHDGERDARHGLSHLEEEFVAKVKALGTDLEAEAKKILAWVVSKV